MPRRLCDVGTDAAASRQPRRHSRCGHLDADRHLRCAGLLPHARPARSRRFPTSRRSRSRSSATQRGSVALASGVPVEARRAVVGDRRDRHRHRAVGPARRRRLDSGPLSRARRLGHAHACARARCCARPARACSCSPRRACSTARRRPSTGAMPEQFATRVSRRAAAARARAGRRRRARELVTSGASMTWHDLVLYLIARHVGATAAQTVARFFALQWHHDGLAPYIVFQGRNDHGDAADRGRAGLAGDALLRRQSGRGDGPPLRSRRAHVQAPLHRGDRLRADRLCAAPARSRTPSAGSSAPMRPVDEISWQVGYEDAAFFRRLFKRVTGLTPGAYRGASRCRPSPARSASDLCLGARTRNVSHGLSAFCVSPRHRWPWRPRVPSVVKRPRIFRAVDDPTQHCLQTFPSDPDGQRLRRARLWKAAAMAQATGKIPATGRTWVA